MSQLVSLRMQICNHFLKLFEHMSQDSNWLENTGAGPEKKVNDPMTVLMTVPMTVLMTVLMMVLMTVPPQGPAKKKKVMPGPCHGVGTR